MAQVGPISVSQGSANWLRAMLGGAVLLLLVLGLTVVVLWVRMRRAGAAQPPGGERA